MSPDHRYRSGKIKREHSITAGTLQTLAHIATLDEVSAVIPGRIAKATGGTPRVTFQYFTESGMKLLSRTLTAVQEIFVVCLDAERAKVAKRKLEEAGVLAKEITGTTLLRGDTAGSKVPAGKGKGNGGQVLRGSRKRRSADDAGRSRSPKREKTPASKLRNWTDGDDEALSHLGPRIDDATRAALRRMKRRLK